MVTHPSTAIIEPCFSGTSPASMAGEVKDAVLGKRLENNSWKTGGRSIKRSESTKHGSRAESMNSKCHVQPEQPAFEFPGVHNSWEAQPKFGISAGVAFAYKLPSLSMLSCLGMPGDLRAFLVPLDKLVRLKKSWSLTGRAYCSGVYVSVCLLSCSPVCFQAWLMARECCTRLLFMLWTVCWMLWWPVMIPYNDRPPPVLDQVLGIHGTLWNGHVESTFHMQKIQTEPQCPHLCTDNTTTTS